MLLSYDGKLSLDDDVRRWIPEFRASVGPITIRQLLQHQAGLREWGDIVELSGWPRGTRAYQMDEITALIARQSALNFPPGSEYLYNNSNYIIAAAIVARNSGESFAAFTTRRIFVPLGMTDTSRRDDYTGAYASTDADASWTVRVVNDSLRVLRRTGQSDVMVAKYADAFTVPSQGWLVTFRRDARGRVAGFEVRTTRMRAMGFERVAAGAGSRQTRSSP